MSGLPVAQEAERLGSTAERRSGWVSSTPESSTATTVRRSPARSADAPPIIRRPHCGRPCGSAAGGMSSAGSSSPDRSSTDLVGPPPARAQAPLGWSGSATEWLDPAAAMPGADRTRAAKAAPGPSASTTPICG